MFKKTRCFFIATTDFKILKKNTHLELSFFKNGLKNSFMSLNSLSFYFTGPKCSMRCCFLFATNKISIQNKHKRLLRKIVDHVYFYKNFLFKKKKEKIKITFRSF